MCVYNVYLDIFTVLLFPYCKIIIVMYDYVISIQVEKRIRDAIS